jgi:hypothetical protein
MAQLSPLAQRILDEGMLRQKEGKQALLDKPLRRMVGENNIPRHDVVEALKEIVEYCIREGKLAPAEETPSLIQAEPHEDPSAKNM